MKKGMMCKFMEETVSKFCEQMTCLLKKNGGKYFVGDCVSKFGKFHSSHKIPRHTVLQCMLVEEENDVDFS